MPKTTNRQTDKGPGKEFIDLQKNLDQAVNERGEANASRTPAAGDANDKENKPIANIKKAGKSKH